MNAKSIPLAWIQPRAAVVGRLIPLLLITLLLLLTACDSLSGLDEGATTNHSWQDSLWSTAPITTVPTAKPHTSSPPTTQKPSAVSDNVTVWNVWHDNYLNPFFPGLPAPAQRPPSSNTKSASSQP